MLNTTLLRSFFTSLYIFSLYLALTCVTTPCYNKNVQLYLRHK